MRLKKIVVHGFKSFADRTILEFNEGVTGIVGPNGCGKSNIADAFRWVLGEQSAKSMRGEKMQDIIFAGTPQRKPLNFAEVILTFTDVQGTLPVEFDEVEIGRKLYRSGESEYRLNGNIVRLKDVQSLFWDSGLGKDAFAIFEQGKIEQIILKTPEERRAIFEEAAGVLRFRQRRKEAARKLEQTEANMTRLDDILREVKKQMDVLESQVIEAKQFRENKVRLEELEKGLVLGKWNLANAERLKLSTQLAAAHEEMAKKGVEKEEAERKQRDVQAALAEREKTLQSRTEDLFRARNAKEIKIVEYQTTQQRLQEATERLQRLTKELEELQERRRLAQQEFVTGEKKAAELKDQIANAEEIWQKSRAAVHQVQKNVNDLREHQKSVQQEQFDLVQKTHAVTSQLQESRVRLESSQERISYLDQEKKRALQLAQTLAQNIQEKRMALEKLSQAIDLQKQQLLALESDIAAKVEEAKNLQKELEKLLTTATEARARQKVLLRLKEEMEGFSPATKRLLQESSNAKSPLFGKLVPLYERITPKEGFEAALAAVMRSYSQTLLVETIEDFTLVCKFAFDQGLNGFSLTTPDLLKRGPQKEKEQADALLKHMRKDGETEALLKSVSYNENSKLAFVQQLIEDSKKDVVNSEGIYQDHLGILFFPAKGESNTFLREAELKRLTAEIEQHDAARKKMEAQIQQLNQLRTQLQTQRNELDRQQRMEEMKLIEVNFGLQRALQDLEAAENDGKRYEQEIASLKTLAQQLAQAVEKLAVEQEIARSKLEKQQLLFQKVDTDLENLLTSLKELSREQHQKEQTFNQFVDEHRRIQNNLKIFEAREQENQRQEKRISEETLSLQEMQKELAGQAAAFEQRLHEFEKEYEEIASRCNALEVERKSWKERLASAEKEGSKGLQQIREIESQGHRLELQIAQQISSCQTLEQELMERHQLTLDQVRELEIRMEATLEQSEKTARHLRRELEKANQVNLGAIEEFETHKERFSYLNTQIGDLDGSKKELLDIIQELDSSSRKQFKETFEKIRENFRKQFQILFEGGEADLTFTDSEDILEAGVDIIAKPPGKQMRSITLLSGGEKCLTAMALLFSIFEVKPAPFCILDEMDAPLDDTNIERFVRVLGPFMEKTQFLIITHNKRTMSVADVLFGVSMEVRGVSKLISIEFDRERDTQEAIQIG